MIGQTEARGNGEGTPGVARMGVKDFSLHRPLPVWQRLDVWPFALLHLLNLSSFVYFCTSDPASVDVSLGAGNSTTPVDKNISSFLGCRLHLVNHVLFPVVCVLHIVAHLGTYWSVRFKVSPPQLRTVC